MKTFHDLIVSEIQKIKGVYNVLECYENPNKYGHTYTSIYFRYEFVEEFNYLIGDFTFCYNNNCLFIPDIGYTYLNGPDLQEIMNLVKSRYKL